MDDEPLSDEWRRLSRIQKALLVVFAIALFLIPTVVILL
jgi:hypothetical protein